LSDTAIVWFRRDLRLYDNPALHSARSEFARIVPVFILAAEEDDPWPPGAASRWWLHHSLESLGRDLDRLGSRLALYRGDSLSVLMMLCRRHGACAVYWNRLYEPAAAARDARVAKALRSVGIQSRGLPGHLLREPDEVMTGSGTPYEVFTPYSRASFRLGDPAEPLAAVNPGAVPESANREDGLASFRLLPRIRWDSGLSDCWRVGEAAAWQGLERFIDCCAHGYADARDRPSMDATSRLSPHLHFGEISPRSVWHAVRRAMAGKRREAAADPFLRQLLWRDFAHQLLYHNPHIAQRNFRPAFDAFPWRNSPEAIQAWREGMTGVPLVDAGMRELWHTGFMHNRVRMNAASFLTKNAGIHWLDGARWFWDTLVDADLANNTMGWQWVAGSGPDAAPYFRVFNPATQGRRFDPHGEYLRRWVPEISGLPDEHIHEPWLAPGDVLSRAGIDLGRTYPGPILDLKTTRQRALEAYRQYVRGR